MKIERVILDELINRYEKKKVDSSRRVIIPAAWFDAYDLNSLTAKKAFHLAVAELASKGFITYTWMKFEKDNLLDRLILNEEFVETCYAYLGRTPKVLWVQQLTEEVLQVRETFEAPWITDLLDNVLRQLDEKGRTGPYIPEDKLMRQNFWSLLEAVEKGITMSERYMSAALFGDSKYFEKHLRSKLAGAAKKYMSTDLGTEQVLEYLGITNNPEEILIWGDLKFRLAGTDEDKPPVNAKDASTVISTGIYKYGTSINAQTVLHMQLLEVKASKVVTIENKATYYEYIRYADTQELVIYLGGFFGEAVRNFLSKIAVGEPKIEFYHWGDVDLGGLQIFRYLCGVLDRQIRPLLMDEVTYHRYANQYNLLTKAQLSQIKSLLMEPWMEALKPTIQAVLDNGWRLEQERIVLSDNFRYRYLRSCDG